jgi:hypothetical protein
VGERRLTCSELRRGSSTLEDLAILSAKQCKGLRSRSGDCAEAEELLRSLGTFPLDIEIGRNGHNFDRLEATAHVLAMLWTLELHDLSDLNHTSMCKRNSRGWRTYLNQGVNDAGLEIDRA